jgi:hypothetical protein
MPFIQTPLARTQIECTTEGYHIVTVCVQYYDVAVSCCLSSKQMSTSKQCKVLIKKGRGLTTTRSSKLPSESPDSIDAITTELKFSQ